MHYQKHNYAELKLLLGRSLSHLIKRLSFISRRNFLSSYGNTLKSPSEGIKFHHSK